MAARDIMPWDNAHGGHADIRHFRLNAAETFVVGEPVSVNADGELTESADDPVAVDFAGIALAPPSYDIGGTTVTRNWRTGANFATGDMVPIVMARTGQRFISENFATAGAGAGVLVTPTLANALGEVVGLVMDAGGDDWFLSTGGTAGREIGRVIDVLDANRNSLQDPDYANNTGVFVVVEIIQSQWTVTTDPAA